MFLPLVDRSYYTYNNQIPEFIPGLLCAMIAVLTPDLAVARRNAQIDQRRLIGRACEWPNSQLPQTPLPSDVEEELSRFAWARISLNPERPRRSGERGRAGDRIGSRCARPTSFLSSKGRKSRPGKHHSRARIPPGKRRSHQEPLKWPSAPPHNTALCEAGREVQAHTTEVSAHGAAPPQNSSCIKIYLVIYL